MQTPPTVDRLVHPLILQGFLPFFVCLLHRTPFTTPQVHPPPWKEELLDSDAGPEEASLLVSGAVAAVAAAASSDEIPVEELDTDLATT